MQENKLEMKDFVPNLLRRTEIPCMRLKLVDTTPGIAESKFGGNVINLKRLLNGKQNVWKYQNGEEKSDSDGREKDV